MSREFDLSQLESGSLARRLWALATGVPELPQPRLIVFSFKRFFWSLKHEWTNWREFENLEDARLSVFNYIEISYNPRRRHQTLGYKSPDQFEAEDATAQAA